MIVELANLPSIEEENGKRLKITYVENTSTHKYLSYKDVDYKPVKCTKNRSVSTLELLLQKIL